MSLEQALNENTAAIKELSLIMAGIKATDPTDTAKTQPQTTNVKQAGAATGGLKQVKEPASTPSATTTGTAKTETAATTPSKTDAHAITYEEAKAAVTAVVKAKGRDAGLAVLAKFGVESLLSVKPEQWAAVIAVCEEALK